MWVAAEELENFKAEAAIDNIKSRLNESGSYSVTIKSRKKDGSEGWKQITMTWLDDTGDWILIQQSDISDAVHRQQQELLERLDAEKALRYEAEKANESKSNFISNVSHDMRTPLNAILGYDSLAMEADSPEAKRYL